MRIRFFCVCPPPHAPLSLFFTPALKDLKMNMSCLNPAIGILRLPLHINTEPPFSPARMV